MGSLTQPICRASTTTFGDNLDVPCSGMMYHYIFFAVFDADIKYKGYLSVD